VEEVREAWTWRWRRSMVPMAVKVEQTARFPSAAVKTGRMAHAEDAKEGARWRAHGRGGHGGCKGGVDMEDAKEERPSTSVWQRNDRLGFRGSSTLKKKNSNDRYDDVINTRRYI
jgi:hypothetical protein